MQKIIISLVLLTVLGLGGNSMYQTIAKNKSSSATSENIIASSTNSSGIDNVSDTGGDQISSRPDLRFRDDGYEDDEDGYKGENENRGNINVNTSTASGSNNSTQKVFTMAEVQKHNNASSCYSVVRGNVYDLTSAINSHPGGAQAILKLCGTDGTSAFVAQHGGRPRQENVLANLQIGVLK